MEFFLVMTFLVVLLFGWPSRYGDILLGQSGRKPDFSLLTRLGLILLLERGSLLYLASVEWIWIIQQPPFGATAEALRLLVGPLLMACSIGAVRMGMVFDLRRSIGWFMHVKKTNSLKVSDLCRGCPGTHADGFADIV